MQKFELIIFDAEDILYIIPRKRIEKSLKTFFIKHNFWDFRRAREVWNRLMGKSSRGLMTLRQAHKIWFKTLGLGVKLAKDWDAIYRNCLKHTKRAHFVNFVLKKLKRHGYRLAILSDTFLTKKELLEILKNAKIDYELFDEIFTSHDIKILKPNKNAYRTVSKHFRVELKRTIFIGHAKDEIEGAKRNRLLTFGINPEKDSNPDFEVENLKEILPKLIGRGS